MLVLECLALGAEGRVVREDKFIEVNASLQELQGQVLWSEILREPYSAENILAMQRRISGEISRLLGTTLEAPAYCGETTDIDAMELYYRGRMKVGTRITETMEEGMELLRQAVEADPYFGRGWAQLGSAQLVLSGRLRDPVEGDREQHVETVGAFLHDRGGGLGHGAAVPRRLAAGAAEH